MSHDWPLTSRYGTHSLRVVAAMTDSTVLPRDATSEPLPDAEPAREAEDYRLWSRPVPATGSPWSGPRSSFPVDAAGVAVCLPGTAGSYAGQPFAFHDAGVAAYILKPAARAGVKLFASAAVDAQTGTAPPQLRPGLAKYSSGNSLLNYSSQVQVRGGEQYLPGNRQFTATTELRLPLGDVLEPMVFVDTVVASDARSRQPPRHAAEPRSARACASRRRPASAWNRLGRASCPAARRSGSGSSTWPSGRTCRSGRLAPRVRRKGGLPRSPGGARPALEAGPHAPYRVTLNSTTSFDTVPRESASCLPSRDHANAKMNWSAKRVSASARPRRTPPSTHCRRRPCCST